MQQWIAECELRWGVEIRSAWIINAASMTIRKSGPTLISYSAALTPQQATLAIAMMLGALALGWAGVRFRFRFPLPDDSPAQRKATQRTRRDYRLAERWARRYLLPDQVLAQAAREEWELWRLEEHSGLDAEACERRVLEWRIRELNRTPSPATVDLDGPIPF